MSLFGRENIVATNLEDEVKSSYLDYSMSVIVSRALPDARDGLKPVHRRILYGMLELGMQPDKPYKKSARIVGDVLGKYHPHGDSSVYDAMVRMAQEWAMRYPLVDGQGNFGSIDGDPPAAMRYTEARLAKIAMETLKDINKNTVDFVPNFDETLKEPSVLPTALPILLVNGTSGIAVGMATNIPPHNLSETVDALVAYVKNPDIELDEIMKYLPAPDFPTGGIIYGYEGIKEAYATGRGKIIVRAKAAIEEDKKGKTSIIVREIPYQVNKSNLIEKIADLVRKKEIEGISDIRDESDRDGIRIAIEIKRDAIASVVLNNLYKKTQMQVTFGANMLALVDKQPKTLNLKGLMKVFIEHRNEVLIRRVKFDLDEAERKAHILEGLIVALDNIDEIIKLIKQAKDAKEASSALRANFDLTEIQAKAILDMKLQRLTGLEKEKILNDYKETIQKIEYLKSILASKELQNQIIIDELLEIKKKYGDERRTEIVYRNEDFSIEDLIANEEVIVTISHKGFIKRTPAATYRRQRKGGRGSIGATSYDDDFVERVFQASTHNHILFFTNKGKCFKVKIYDLPEGGRNAKGRSIANVIPIESDEKATAYLPIKEFEEGKYIFMATKRGVVKKTELKAFANVRSSGIRAIILKENDDLINAVLTDGSNDIILATRNGLACRFRESETRPMGRTAAGVKGINLNEDDRVVSLVAITRPDEQLLIIGEKGLGKRSRYEDFRLTKRGAKGVKTMHITEKTGKIAQVLTALDSEDLVVITHKGILIRQPVKDIRTIGRNTQGVRLIKLDPDDAIADVTTVSRQENKDNGQEENDEAKNGDNANNSLNF